MRLLSLETIRLGLRNLWLHKLRSLLTSLGIIFGVAAVICMLSISEGASADELRMIQLLGTKNIIINSTKPQQSDKVGQGNVRMVEYGITPGDISSILQTLPHVAHVVPLKEIAHRVRRGEHEYPATSVGTTPALFQVVNIKVARGRVLTDADMTSDNNVCVIGAEVARKLFPFEDPLGQTILLDRITSGVPFTVVGVLQEVEVAGAPERGVEERNLNREIFIPETTARAQFGAMNVRLQAGSREMTKVHCSSLYVAVDEIDHVLPVSELVKRVFAHKHEDLDYEVRVPLARLQLAEKKKRNNQFTLGFIAGISLLVGGIGIMNIMLATVTERTREIGIRRALGAKRRHITTQFLVETVVLSTTGGLIGVLLGFVGSQMLSRIAEWTPIVSFWSVGVSFGLSILVGIFFGMYPAMSAAKLDPIEALRYE
jgi:putative ABC transport system permease protein